MAEFQLYDDFEDGSFDTSKWSTNRSNQIDESGGKLNTFQDWEEVNISSGSISVPEEVVGWKADVAQQVITSGIGDPRHSFQVRDENGNVLITISVNIGDDDVNAYARDGGSATLANNAYDSYRSTLEITHNGGGEYFVSASGYGSATLQGKQPDTSAGITEVFIEGRAGSSDAETETDIYEAYYAVPVAPGDPQNVNASYVADDQIDLSFDENTSDGDPADSFDVEINRDGTGWSDPAGGPSDPTTDGTYSYGPNSDTAYERQVGVDSSFQFRVRAVNDVGASGWTTSDTVYTTPVPPENPTVNRPNANTVELTWTQATDIVDYTQIQYRIDTGNGYGGWNFLDNQFNNSESFTWSPTSGSQSGDDLQPDARYQFRTAEFRRGNDSGRLQSEWVYFDYGNEGNVYFEDDFEDQDLSEWLTGGLDSGDPDTGIQSSPSGTSDFRISGAQQGTYFLQLDSGDYVDAPLGDMTGESDVMVRAAVAVGSMDSDAEETRIKYISGDGTQTTLRNFGWEYNRAGWVQVTALVPDSALGTDDRVRFQGYGGGGDHFAIDNVVVSDILDEYTSPQPPTDLSASGGDREITASWTNNTSLLPNQRGEIRTRVSGSGDPLDKLGTDVDASPVTYGPNDGSVHTVPVRDGEQYDVRVDALFQQDRRGSPSSYWRASSAFLTATTILPAPTNLSASNVGAADADLSWGVNTADADSQRVYLKEPGDERAGMLFGGSGDQIALNKSLNGTFSQLSVAVWIKTTDTDIIAVNHDRSEYYRLGVGSQVTANKIDFNPHTASGQSDLAGNTDVNDGEWHHIAAVFDTGNVTLYLDGEVDAQYSGIGTPLGTGIDRYGYIGVGSEADVPGGDTGPDSFWNGSLSGAVLADSAWSQSQIQNAMSGSIPTEGLRGYWPLDLRLGGVTPDLTQYAGDGYENGLRMANGAFDSLYKWNVTRGGLVSDRVYVGDNSFYATGGDGTGIQAQQTLLSPYQPTTFSYVYQETTSSFGAGIRLVNSNGEYEGGTATDNPEWYVDFESGEQQVTAGPSGDYDEWVSVEWAFDWSVSEVTVSWEALTSGDTYSDTYTLKQGRDVAGVELWNFHSTTGGWGEGEIDMWWDAIRFDGNDGSGGPTLTGPALFDATGALGWDATSANVSSLLNGQLYEAYVHSETEDSIVRDQ